MTRMACWLFPLALAAGSAGAAAPQDPAREFQALCAARAAGAAQAGTMTVAGRDGWLYLASELRFLGAGPFWGEAAPAVSRASNPAHADPVPAIADFQQQLAALGVELLLVPVPPKAALYPEGLLDAAPPPGAQRLDPHLESFYGRLRLKGIHVLDLAPVFLKRRAAGEPLYCRQDSHWSGTGCALAAAEIRMELFATFDGAPRQALTGEWDQVEIRGDLWQALPEPRPDRERVRLRRVRRADSAEPLEPDPRSPVVLLGDSHTLVFHGGDDMHARGAGLPDQLALELGFPVDLAGVRGSGATPARINLLRRAQRDTGYWAGRKWVVWCFAAREFTESDGWRLVPVKP